MPILLGGMFKARVKEMPDKECLVDWARVKGGSGERLTYRQTQEKVYKLCNALHDLGIRKGDRVAIAAWNSNEVVEVALGAAAAGYTYCHLNPDLSPDELVEIIDNRMASSTVFFDKEYRGNIKEIMPRLKTVRNYICFNGKSEGKIMSFNDLISSYSPTEPDTIINGNELFALYCTGGTTGTPKLAMSTHEASMWNANNMLPLYEIGSEDIEGHISPNFWSTYLPSCFWPAIYMGCKSVIFDGKLDINQFLEGVTREKITFAIIPSTTWLSLVDLPLKELRKHDLSSLKNPLVIGYTFTPAILRRSRERLGVTPAQLLASCEATPYSMMTKKDIEKLLDGPPETQRKVSSMGVPAPNTRLRIIDAEGNDCPPGVMGELIVKSDCQAIGYYGQPEKTKEVFKDGWVYTGNMCTWGKDGYYYLEGRKEDMGVIPVTREGRFISPLKVQEIILENVPAVAEAGVIAIPHLERKAILKAIIYPRPGEKAEVEDILKACRKVAPDYLISEDVALRDSPLPKTPSGKLIMTELRREYG